LNGISTFQYIKTYEKNDFAKISKNLARQRLNFLNFDDKAAKDFNILEYPT